MQRRGIFKSNQISQESKFAKLYSLDSINTLVIGKNTQIQYAQIFSIISKPMIFISVQSAEVSTEEDPSNSVFRVKSNRTRATKKRGGEGKEGDR